MAELSGLAAAARQDGDVTLVPLVSGFAVPSGKLEPSTWETILSELLARLESAAKVGAVDGVFLALHGSMRVRGQAGSPEAQLVAEIRALCPEARIAATFDLHANLGPALVRDLDIIQSFRANPHWDLFPTGYRAGRTLLRALRAEVQPTSEWRKLPIVLGGGAGLSFTGPSSEVFRRMKAMHRRHARLLHTSFNMSHVFSDAEDLGWSVHVTTDADEALAAEMAEELAECAWQIRKAPLPEFVSVEDALAAVRARGRRRRHFPSTLVDMGDGVLSGATGGSTFILRALTRARARLCVFVPLHDPALVAFASKRVGDEMEFHVEGTPGLAQPPLYLRGRVRRAVDTRECGKLAHLDLGSVQLVASERPPLSAHPRFFRQVGLDPRRADAIVQKSFFQYRLLYAGISHHHVSVDSPGPSDLHAASRRAFSYPRYPASDPRGWREFDALQRAAR